MKKALSALLIFLLCMGGTFAAAEKNELPIDLDMKDASDTIAYTLVYDMQNYPDKYGGKRIRLRGELSYVLEAATGQEYFTIVIRDATACCKQWVEFVRADEARYPEDYPPLDTVITVAGLYNTYEESGNIYVQLLDAQIDWTGRE